jgi:ribonuclease HII
MLHLERRLWQAGYAVVAGLDEAGRGALAGPVAVAAVVLPNDPRLSRRLGAVRDSKQLTAGQRESLAPLIRAHAHAWGIGAATAAEIDWLGIVPATRLAAARALEGLAVFPEFLVTDFRLELPELDTPQVSLVRGDQQSMSIAAASILAKTWRDACMCDLDMEYQKYGFARHKGYGTSLHRRALRRAGPSPVHRRSFAFRT